jgi:hypothetical protein
MKKKLLVLLITVAATMMPSFASAIAIEYPDEFVPFDSSF